MPPKEENQPPPSPESTTGVEMDLEDLAQAPALPPGVYFSPTKPESVLEFLNRWMAGHAMPDAVGWVIEADVYGEDPDALARRYRPASTRNSEPSWWFLCHCKLQARRGGADRRVATGGGHWKQEQKMQDVACEVSGERFGFKRSFGFYLHDKDRKEKETAKTFWLMEEFTSVVCPEDGVALGDGKKVLPALYRMYITPRDHVDKDKNGKKKRGRGDEQDDDGAPMRPARVMVPAAYFDAIAALLPPSSVPGGVGQEQAPDAGEAPPPLLPGAVDPYQGHDASPEDDSAMNEDEQRDLPLLPVNEGVMVWQMGRDDVLADSSWIDEHYT